jgi:site-specific DNA-methyltransferase (adenine-specific)
MLAKELRDAFVTSDIGNSIVVHADSFDWLKHAAAESIHAIVTDPPYGVKEYEESELQKKAEGIGGVWRIPPSFDGNTRAPLPRFTALNARELNQLREFFVEWSRLCLHVLKPGGHVFVASNAFLSQQVFEAISKGGLEFRGEIIRVVRTLRGGDRPKNAEAEFPDVCTLPRGCYEPWGLFRKALPSKMTVAECLREHGTGGLRRQPDGNPLNDVIPSERTPQTEREIAPHASLKPQSFLRQIAYASLPLGTGVILDPFMGSGSTIAAAEAIGYAAIGIERNPEFYQMSLGAIPKLTSLSQTLFKGRQLQLPLNLE